MKKRALPILLVVAMLITALAITAMATDTPVAPNDVSEYARTELSAALASVSAGGTGKAVCPVCNKEVTWYSQGSFNSNLGMRNFHWFIQGDLNNSAMFTVPAGVNCIYLNGHSITSTSIVFETSKNAILNIIGNGTENEIVQGGGPAGDWANQGETIHPYGGGVTVNLYGGVYKKTNTSSRAIISASAAYTLNVYNGTRIEGGISTGSGGNISAPGTGSSINIYGGTVSNGQATKGGNIYANGSTVTISGGSVSGSNATSGGGNIFVTASTLNVNGGTITKGSASSGGNIYAEGGAVNVTSGTVSGGTATNYGGNLYTDSYTDINISGGSFTGGSAKNGGSIYIENSDFTFTGGTISDGHATEKGGNICLSANSTKLATVTINDSDGGAAPAVSDGQAGDLSAGYGGNIYLNVYSGKTTTIEDLSLTGGSAKNNGGGLFLDGSGTLNLTDVSFNGGSAANGANFYNNGLTVNISGGSFVDGNANTQGGNIFSYYGNVTIKDGTQISGGYAKVDGGNIFLTYLCKCNLSAELSGGEAGRWGGSIAVENSTLNISDSTITGGYASRGGAIYTFTGTKLEITDTEISGGEATEGGNLFVADDAGTTTLTGTTISGGTATTGGNAYIHAATTFTSCEFTIEEGASGTGTQIYNDALVTLNSCTLNDGVVFADGGVTVNGGNVYYIYIRQGQLTLDGAAQVSRVNMNKYNTTYATLLVKSTFTGEATVEALASIPEALGCGKTLDSKYTADGDFNGKLILSWLDSKPWAFNDNNTLVVGNARTVKEGVTSWHKDNASAVQNYNGADWLIPGSVDLPLAGGTYTVNVAGIHLNVTGTGTVTFFDTANKDFMSYGELTVAETVTVANEFATEAPDGNTYYMVESEDKLSFHRLGIKVNGVSVRPSVAGIYYTSKWECDDLLKTKIKFFGVAVSLVHQPNAQFLEDDYCLYTQFGGGEFVSGETKTSVLITEIMKAGADNETRGTKPIYATAYVLLDNGSGITSVVDNGDVRYSLQDTMKLLDANEALYNANKEAIDAFYATWESVMSNWGFERIGKSAQTI